MIELTIVIIFILLVTGFVGFGEWLNDKYQFIDTREVDYQDHLGEGQADKYYVRKQS